MLKYMQCFLKEVMRMYSIVPITGRCLHEPLTIDGVTLPAGSSLEINIHAINHRPDVWSDHEVRSKVFELHLYNKLEYSLTKLAR